MKFQSKEMFPPKKVDYEDLIDANTVIEQANLNGDKTGVDVAWAKFDNIEMSLKKLNRIPASSEEEIAFALDKLFPQARNKQVVSYEGNKYQLLFTLVGEDGRKKVWKREWNLVSDESKIERKELFPADESTLELYNSLQDELMSMKEESKNDNSDKASWLGRSERRGNRIDEVNGLIYRMKISLQKRDLLPSTEREKLYFNLDKIAYGMRNGEVLEHEGHFFQLSFFPLAKSNSGKTVHVWAREWAEVSAP